jgi:Zn-dependent peptidase ImmA (M78 family)
MSCPISTPRWKEANKAAKNLAAPYSSPPIPVLEIAQNSGVNVIFTDFGSHSEKIAGFCDFDAARIYVNENDPLVRQMFTMAHELGHWILHREYFVKEPELYPILPRYQIVKNTNAFEQEANCFAARLLVPDVLLKPVKNTPVSILADMFCVSRAMMENRLGNNRSNND